MKNQFFIRFLLNEYSTHTLWVIAPDLFIVPSIFRTRIGLSNRVAFLKSTTDLSMNLPSAPQSMRVVVAEIFSPWVTVTGRDNFLSDFEDTITDRRWTSSSPVTVTLVTLFLGTKDSALLFLLKNPTTRVELYTVLFRHLPRIRESLESGALETKRRVV